ncbi:unnamed protein product [Rotaria sordida]|uniref:Endonuclease/exonuclease/phosphatase domain-containing protein n=1 Tax=Rotaria sordida TaxID=392033 RepID=A0A813S6J5_9BILA|nr:unnamed protein product [Rotaria sordida]CAF0866648.1 unnamed protein product [Rotaria sordida]CAF3718711.1 unnamed protein product [Rotaria sordida]CAF3961397.1 unnamed protein product [Rotaria sordida]
MTTFRLATLNVHSFADHLAYRDNMNRLINILKPYNFDLIAVQETLNDDNWSKFCNLLGLNHFIYGPCEEHIFGNGIASRYPIKTYSNQRTSYSYLGGRRSLLECCLDSNHPFVKDRIFAVTHLDHLNEHDRLKQIKEFDPWNKNIDIFMGDMNSLTQDDYSNNYFEKNIFELRKKSNWEKPYFDVTQLITNQWLYKDAFKQINPNLKDKQLATCRYGTRIDYIYLHPRIYDSWILKDCSIIDTQNATDHNAVFAIFEQKQNL